MRTYMEDKITSKIEHCQSWTTEIKIDNVIKHGMGEGEKYFTAKVEDIKGLPNKRVLKVSMSDDRSVTINGVSLFDRELDLLREFLNQKFKDIE